MLKAFFYYYLNLFKKGGSIRTIITKINQRFISKNKLQIDQLKVYEGNNEVLNQKVTELLEENFLKSIVSECKYLDNKSSKICTIQDFRNCYLSVLSKEIFENKVLKILYQNLLDKNSFCGNSIIHNMYILRAAYNIFYSIKNKSTKDKILQNIIDNYDLENMKIIIGKKLPLNFSDNNYIIPDAYLILKKGESIKYLIIEMEYKNKLAKNKIEFYKNNNNILDIALFYVEKHSKYKLKVDFKWLK